MHELPFSASVSAWFQQRFGVPTAIQQAAWPVVASGAHCLISAGTGQGKSMAALLPLLDAVLSKPAGTTPERVLYLSPLRALSNNMGHGLTADLASLPDTATRLRIAVRTGDTGRSERQRQIKSKPDLLLTTPESLYILLGSRRGRALLGGLRAVVIDEVHALMNNKRGAHLALSLERLQRLQAGGVLQRVGMSATARPAQWVAGYLAGAGRRCTVVAPAASNSLDLHIETGREPLGPFPRGIHWQCIFERIADLIRGGGTTLIFCPTRALVERVALELARTLGQDLVAAHHGSLGVERRATIERQLRAGRLRAVVSSATLELGIDIGPLERVCQIGQVGSIGAVRQRAGRARHRPGQRPRIHLFPLTLSDLLDAQGLADALQAQFTETSFLPSGSLDTLAQQVVAMAAAGEESEDAMFRLVRGAAPYAQLSRERFDAVLDMLHHGYVEGRATGGGPLLRLAGGRVQPAQSAVRDCLLNAGTIPVWFDYEVHDLDRGLSIGRLDEEFAFESSPGEVIQLGGENYRIERVGCGRVDVRGCDRSEAALPFWLGEGPGRSSMLSSFVRRHLAAVERGRYPAQAQIGAFLAAARQQLGALPGSRRIILERFFDPGGDEHLVIHAPFGQRINRAWGLALRKRFCRQFNFELQAAATDNAILISLGATHSFDLADVIGFLSAESVRGVLVQAVLDMPLFFTRLRWCANNALAIRRRDDAGPVPAQIQRNQAENLIARIFPDQLACLENLSGPRQVPDHPLVRQALADCLEDHMDLVGLERLYRTIERGSMEIVTIQTLSPSVLAECILHAPRYGHLDPAAAEERRTRAFEGPARPSIPAAGSAASEPSGGSRNSTWLEPRLLQWLYLPRAHGERMGAAEAFVKLVRQGAAVALWSNSRTCLWIHANNLAVWLTLCPDARLHPFHPRALRPAGLDCRIEAARRIALGAVKRTGQAESAELAAETGLAAGELDLALLGLQSEGLLQAGVGPAGNVYRERRPASVPSAAEVIW